MMSFPHVLDVLFPQAAGAKHGEASLHEVNEGALCDVDHWVVNEMYAIPIGR